MLHRRALLLVLLILVPSCSKSGGDTTIINQDVVPANPVVKAWRIPEMLGAANATSASFGDLRFDTMGNAIAVFMERGIWASRWSAATGWTLTERISDASTFGSAPKIAVDGAGNAIVVYTQLDDPSGGFETSVWWNRFVLGTGWGTPQLLESDDLIAGDVQIAGDAAGNAIAVWGSTDGFSSDLYYNRYVAGTGWTGASPLENGPEVASSARIGMDASGIATAIWNLDYAVTSARYVPGTGWTTPVALETNSSFVGEMEVAVNAVGDALAIWIERPSALGDLWSASYRPATGWSAPGLVETENQVTVLGTLQVVLDSAGSGTAAWQSSDGGPAKIWTGRFSPSGGWTSVEPLGSLTNGDSARLAATSSGATGIIWMHADGYRGNVLFSSHDGAGPWSSPEFVEFYDLQCGNPVLALDGAGNGMALWSYYEAIGGFRTWANRFD